MKPASDPRIGVTVFLCDDTPVGVMSSANHEGLKINANSVHRVDIFVENLRQALALHEATGRIVTNLQNRVDQVELIQRQAGQIAELEEQLRQAREEGQPAEQTTAAS